MWLSNELCPIPVCQSHVWLPSGIKISCHCLPGPSHLWLPCWPRGLKDFSCGPWCQAQACVRGLRSKPRMMVYTPWYDWSPDSSCHTINTADIINHNMERGKRKVDYQEVWRESALRDKRCIGCDGLLVNGFLGNRSIILSSWLNVGLSSFLYAQQSTNISWNTNKNNCLQIDLAICCSILSSISINCQRTFWTKLDSKLLYFFIG